jgi:hypothetical protein
VNHFVPPDPVDFLTRVIPLIKSDLDAADHLPTRARIFWAGVLAARDLGASDVVERDFWQLAFDAKLIWDQVDRKRRGVLPHSYETVGHLIRWGIRGWDPFGAWRPFNPNGTP